MTRPTTRLRAADSPHLDGMAQYTSGGILVVGEGTADLRGLPDSFIGTLPARISASPLRLLLLTTTPANAFTSFPVETQADPKGAVFQDVPRVWLGTHQAVREAAQMLLDGGVTPDGEHEVIDAELADVAGDPAAVAAWLRSAQIALRISAALLPERLEKGKVVSPNPMHAPMAATSAFSGSFAQAALYAWFNTPAPDPARLPAMREVISKQSGKRYYVAVDGSKIGNAHTLSVETL